MADHEVVILYRNWRGETASRTILPKSVYYVQANGILKSSGF